MIVLCYSSEARYGFCYCRVVWCGRFISYIFFRGLNISRGRDHRGWAHLLAPSLSQQNSGGWAIEEPSNDINQHVIGGSGLEMTCCFEGQNPFDPAVVLGTQYPMEALISEDPKSAGPVPLAYLLGSTPR